MKTVKHHPDSTLLVFSLVAKWSWLPRWSWSEEKKTKYVWYWTRGYVNIHWHSHMESSVHSDLFRAVNKSLQAMQLHKNCEMQAQEFVKNQWISFCFEQKILILIGHSFECVFILCLNFWKILMGKPFLSFYFEQKVLKANCSLKMF